MKMMKKNSEEVEKADQASLDVGDDPVLQPLDEQTAEWISETLNRLSHSHFRSSFHLSRHDLEYALEKGPETIALHARDFLRQRLGSAHPLKDGRQTPWRGHPVFTAQHATATCCRGCMHRWHHIPLVRPLSDEEINRFSALIMAWIAREVEMAQADVDNTNNTSNTNNANSD